MQEIILKIKCSEYPEIENSLKCIKGIEIKKISSRNFSEISMHLIIPKKYYKAIESTLYHWGKSHKIINGWSLLSVVLQFFPKRSGFSKNKSNG